MAAKKIRPILVSGNIAYVTLTKGHVAIIDAADVPLVEGSNWCSSVNRYAMLSTIRDGKHRYFMMHRVITGAANGLEVDHINGNGFDNRRANLRVATTAQNQWNAGKSAVNKSGYKGVSWVASRGKWVTSIRVNGKRKNLGRFDTAEAAHAAYSEAANRFHGEFAKPA